MTPTREDALRAALELAKSTLRTWSEMGSSAPPQWLDAEWELYQESPEMKQINAALAHPAPAPSAEVEDRCQWCGRAQP